MWGGGRDRGLLAPKKGLIEAGTGICGSQRGRGPAARTAAGIVPPAPGEQGRPGLSPILVVCCVAPLAAQCFGTFSRSPLLQVVLQTPPQPCLWFAAGCFPVEGVLAGS